MCCKLLTKLLRYRREVKEMESVKEKMMALTASKDEIEDLYDMVTDFFEN